MKTKFCILFLLALTCGSLCSQSLATASVADPLFDESEVLHLTFKGNIQQLFKNRRSEPKNYPFTLIFQQPDSVQVAVPCELKTRGHFRRTQGNCAYPPLLLQFSDSLPLRNTIFQGQTKLKIVVPCDPDDNYVVREWLVYKLYNLVTPMSFQARLLKISFEDSKNEAFLAILLEDELQMAKRNGMVSLKRKMRPQNLHQGHFFDTAIFEYMIGNTDWSVQYQQNIKLLYAAAMGFPVAVPYDFDHAGIVHAPYARPAEELKMKSIRERRFRGYCVEDLNDFQASIAKFQALKPDVYQIYKDCKLLDGQYKQSTLSFLDAFFDILTDPVRWKKEFSYPCDPKGTGNVVIKGLRNND